MLHFTLHLTPRRDNPILLEVAKEEFNEEDKPYSYQDEFEPDILEPESDTAEDTARTKDDSMEAECYAIISEVDEPSNVSTVNDESKVPQEQYQTQIQKSNIIIIVRPEEMTQIQLRSHEFDKHLIPYGTNQIWFYMTDPINTIQFMAIAKVPHSLES